MGSNCRRHTVLRPTRAWRLLPIRSEDVRSFSSITSCSAPRYRGGCPACSAIADGLDGLAVHLDHHDVAMIAGLRAPIAALQAYKRRMGWTFTWASSLNSDFNYDFNTSFTEEQQRSGSINYNYSTLGTTSDSEGGSKGHQNRIRARLDFSGDFAAMTGTDVPTYTREAPGMSAFALSEGVIYYTYSTYARGLDALWGIVPVARPGAEWAERKGVVVSAARRVHPRFSIAVTSIFGSQGAYALIVTN